MRVLHSDERSSRLLWVGTSGPTPGHSGTEATIQYRTTIASIAQRVASRLVPDGKGGVRYAFLPTPSSPVLRVVT